MLRVVIAPLFLIATISCKGGDDDDDSTQDATPVDTGDEPDSGEVDMGTPDTGVPNQCNPVDGTGCPNANEFCVYVVAQDNAQCRTLPNMNAFETGCIVAQQNCAPGLTCIQLQGEAAPTCKQVCANADQGAACGGLQGMSTDYVCVFFDAGGGMLTDFGVCDGVDTCVPFNDMCPAGEACGIADQMGNTACFPEGNNGIGMACGGAAGGCMRGGICVNVNMMGAQCHPPCDPANPVCAMGACNPVANGWGICI